MAAQRRRGRPTHQRRADGSALRLASTACAESLFSRTAGCLARLGSRTPLARGAFLSPRADAAPLRFVLGRWARPRLDWSNGNCNAAAQPEARAPAPSALPTAPLQQPARRAPGAGCHAAAQRAPVGPMPSKRSAIAVATGVICGSAFALGPLCSRLRVPARQGTAGGSCCAPLWLESKLARPGWVVEHAHTMAESGDFMHLPHQPAPASPMQTDGG